MIILGKTKQPRSAPTATGRTLRAMLFLALIAPSVAMAVSGDGPPPAAKNTAPAVEEPPRRTVAEIDAEIQRLQREETELTERHNADGAIGDACGPNGANRDTSACRLATLRFERVNAQQHEQEVRRIEDERVTAFNSSPQGQALVESCTDGGGRMEGSQCVFSDRAQKREWNDEHRAITDNAKKRGNGFTEEGSLTGRKYAGEAAVTDQCMSACEQDGTLWEALGVSDGGGQRKSQTNSCRKGTNHFPTSADRKRQLERQIQAMRSSNPPQDTKQQEQRLQQLTTAYNCCESSCQAQAQTRSRNHSNNTRGEYTGGSDGCGQTELILAADKFVAEHGRDYSRKDFFECLNGAQANAPFCQEIKSRGLGSNCNATRMTGQLSDIAAQAAEMALTTRATTEGQNAAAATERAYMQAQNGEGVSVQKTALNESAKAMDRVATQGTVTGAGVLALGAVVGTMAINHTTTASELEDAAGRAGSEVAGLGAYADGTIITGSSAGLVGSAARAVTNVDERDRAEDRGLNNMRQTAENHQQVSREALQQSLALMVKGGTQIAQAASFRRQADDMRELAGTIVETPIAGNFGDGFQGADGSSQLISPPGLGGIGGSGITDQAAIAVAEDESPIGPVMDLGGPEGLPGGPGSSGGLANAPVVSTPLGPRNGAGPKSEGPGLGSASATAAAAPGSEGGEEGDLGNSKARMETIQGAGGGGGGYAAAGGGGGARHKTGMDLNGLLAQFLPNQKGDEKNKKGSGIVDFANQKGARSIASQQNDDGSILGPNSDLFMRVSSTTQLYHRRGQLK